MNEFDAYRLASHFQNVLITSALGLRSINTLNVPLHGESIVPSEPEPAARQVDGTGEVVLEVRRLQKTDISSHQQKRTGAPQLSRWQISFLLPQESRSPEKLLPDV
ncbi:hypothetical protein TNCV_769241 [Trichonephila clavipes]|nr:hypothetical protein TNCV_769241 [Trichonephila clavipes]